MSENLMLSDQRPQRSDAQENYHHILNTAKQLFAEQGVGHVSMSAIAEAAGVGKGTLYRHFPNKIALCQALLDADQRDLQMRTFTHLQTSQSSPRDQLRWFVGETYAFVARNIGMLCVEPDAAMSMLDHPAHLWWRLTIRGLVARMPIALDPDYAADVLYIMLDPRTVVFQRNTVGYDVDRLVDGLMRLVDHLLLPAP